MGPSEVPSVRTVFIQLSSLFLVTQLCGTGLFHLCRGVLEIHCDQHLAMWTLARLGQVWQPQWIKAMRRLQGPTGHQRNGHGESEKLLAEANRRDMQGCTGAWLAPV